MNRFRPLLAAALLLISAPLRAHDTWLFASESAKGGVRLDLTSGMVFPKLDYGPQADRVGRAWGLSDGARVTLPKPSRDASALSFRAPASPASASYAVQLLPKTLVLNEAEVRSYLEEIHASPAQLQRWQQLRRWREEYHKHAKALVLREATCPKLGATALGLGMELLIEADACALRSGSPLPVRALHNGKPKPGLALGLVGANGKEQGSAVTNADGRALLKLPTAGAWLLRATDLRAVDSRNLDWQSDFSTLTFTVR